jgi:hypothetical protein
LLFFSFSYPFLKWNCFSISSFMIWFDFFLSNLVLIFFQIYISFSFFIPFLNLFLSLFLIILVGWEFYVVIFFLFCLLCCDLCYKLWWLDQVGFSHIFFNFIHYHWICYWKLVFFVFFLHFVFIELSWYHVLDRGFSKFTRFNSDLFFISFYFFIFSLQY